MGISDKSKHVGNHGGAYTDIDGNRKQFTIIDHDKKTKISAGISEKVNSTFFADYRKELIERILHVSASLCPMEYQDFTNNRGENVTVITWNEKMLRDSGLGVDRLRGLATLLENKAIYLGIPQ